MRRSLEAVDSHPRGWVGEAPDFNEGNHCSCGGNSMWSLRMGLSLRGGGAAAYWWADQVDSRAGIYWWRCCRDGWNVRKGFRISHKLSWWNRGRVWEKLAPILKQVLLCVSAIKQHRMLQKNPVKDRGHGCGTLGLTWRNCHPHAQLDQPPLWSVRTTLRHDLLLQEDNSPEISDD